MNFNNENDLYNLHLKNYSLLNKKAEKNNIKIDIVKYIQFDEELIAELYCIIFKNKKMFNYNLVSTNINKTYIVIKSKIFMELKNEEDLDNFIIFSINYSNNIYNYYEIIDKYFYINYSLSNYLNEIYIKKYSFTKVENIKINILTNNIFNITINDTNNINNNIKNVNNDTTNINNDINNINKDINNINNDTNNIVNYETIDQVINSEILISFKKKFYKNIINYFL
jgi:hypothetical protein